MRATTRACSFSLAACSLARSLDRCVPSLPLGCRPYFRGPTSPLGGALNCTSFTADEVVSSVLLQLSAPNVAIDSEGVRGNWTMVYNQGVEVALVLLLVLSLGSRNDLVRVQRGKLHGPCSRALWTHSTRVHSPTPSAGLAVLHCNQTSHRRMWHRVACGCNACFATNQAISAGAQATHAHLHKAFDLRWILIFRLIAKTYKSNSFLILLPKSIYFNFIKLKLACA